MSKKTSYTEEQVIHMLSDNGATQHAIAEALEIGRSTVQAVLRREPTSSYAPEIVGDGCSYMIEGGSMPQDKNALTPLDIEEMDLKVSDHPTGQLTKIDSGYPDIYYNERSRQWDVFIHNRRVWRATKLTEACEVRLSKGSLSIKDKELLQAVVSSPDEVQAALNEIPM